ncbi:MAG: hypothetical protein HYV07_15080 [Deltaproteobacteria bacterium]|nr:hypothetical protein [Deltaproteobacteria bacterium]
MSFDNVRPAWLAFALVCSCGQDAGTLELGLSIVPEDAATLTVIVFDLAEQSVVASATVASDRALTERVFVGVPAERHLLVRAIARTSSGTPSWAGSTDVRVELRNEPTLVDLTLRPAGTLVLDTIELDEAVMLKAEPSGDLHGLELAPGAVHRTVLEQGRWTALGEKGQLLGGRALYVARQDTSLARLHGGHEHRRLGLSLSLEADDGETLLDVREGQPFFVRADAERPAGGASWRFAGPTRVEPATGALRELPGRAGPFELERSGSARFIAVADRTGEAATLTAATSATAGPAEKLWLTVLDPTRLDIGSLLAVDVLDANDLPSPAPGSADLAESDPFVFVPEGPRASLSGASALVPIIRSSEPEGRRVTVRASVRTGSIALSADLELPALFPP